MIKVVAFDVFGTVADLSGIDREEIRDYARQLRREEWAPLELPESWNRLPVHKDSQEGIDLLRQDYTVVTCSNGPVKLLNALSKHNDLSWDLIIPLELGKVYKPNPLAYQMICNLLCVKPQEVCFVTANKDFGDIEASASLGMLPMWIRGDSPIQSIIELAGHLKSYGSSEQ